MKNKKINTSYFFVLPYAALFITFIVALIIISLYLSFTYFDTVNFPR
ncbi:MAG: sugar ABC transporter permease, partial [Acholeplasmataceae bacterium]|nr:sugar ABC transporter permease [Acholeplasmataceae bacterium]